MGKDIYFFKYLTSVSMGSTCKQPLDFEKHINLEKHEKLTGVELFINIFKADKIILIVWSKLKEAIMNT